MSRRPKICYGPASDTLIPVPRGSWVDAATPWCSQRACVASAFRACEFILSWLPPSGGSWTRALTLQLKSRSHAIDLFRSSSAEDQPFAGSFRLKAEATGMEVASVLSATDARG